MDQKIYNLEINNVFFKKREGYLMFYAINDRHSNMLWQNITDKFLLYLVKERKTIQCLPDILRRSKINSCSGKPTKICKWIHSILITTEVS